MSDPAAPSPEPRSVVRESILRADGLRTRVLKAGPQAEDEAVVFVHGGPGSARDWDDLLGRTGTFARAIAFDLPGFGQADKPPDWDYSAQGWASFIGAALRELEVERVHLVVNDLGGNAGLAWAAKNAGRFASAVLLNGGTLVGYRWHGIARLHRVPLIGTFAARSGRLGLPAIMRIYEPSLPAAVVRRWAEEYDWGSRRALLRFYRSSPASRLGRGATALRGLNRPGLILWGARDRWVPVAQAERERRECFPSARIRLLARSGHYPHLDDPGTTAAEVTTFLAREMRRESVGGRAPDR